MKKLFGGIANWLQAHPAVKTTVSAVGSAALSGAGSAVYQQVTTGTFSPKTAAAIALGGAVVGVVNLFVKRPQDTPCGQLPPVNRASLYNPCPLRVGHPGPHLYTLKTTS